jgi:short-subunit dehydrogenase
MWWSLEVKSFMNRKVVLITGASSGIGKAAANLFAKDGFRVYGTSRKRQAEEAAEKEADVNGFVRMIQMDVCSAASVKEAIDYILKHEGRIDILVNNAGFGIAGSVEDTSEEEAFKQFDTNFFGVHRVLRQVIPIMRKQGSGLIINVSSVAGLISIPFQAMYSASKYAVEALTEALRLELKPYGIKAVAVEPGDTNTGFTGSRQFVAESENSVYRSRFIKAIDTMIKDETNGPGPEKVARVIIKAARMKNPPVRIVSGFSYKLLVLLRRIIPARLGEFILYKIY